MEKSIHVRLCPLAYGALAAYAHVHRLTLGGAASALMQDQLMGRARGMPAAPARDTSGFVYVIRVGDLCKIGKARDVKDRIRGLHLSATAEIIATQHSAEPFALERQLHAEFKAVRERGEWFHLTDTDIERVRAILSGKAR